MAKRTLPTPELLRKLLRYKPKVGLLYWRERPQNMFPEERYCSTWNTRWAGRDAFRTNINGYYNGSILGVTFRAHRVIWAMHYGEWPSDQIDHIDHDRSNNTIENLRAATQLENSKNMSKRHDNKSGFTGVVWHSVHEKWICSIRVDGKRKHLGYFCDKSDAIDARKKANKEYAFHENHGE